MTTAAISPDEYGAFYANYLSLVPPHLSIAEALAASAGEVESYLASRADRASFAYAPGKWTVAQAVQHLIDTDRIFSYRILRLGRSDGTPLPGFDQDDYADRTGHPARPLPELLQEFALLRAATIHLVASMREVDLPFVGQVSSNPMSCRAMAFIMAGHTYHHGIIFRERYG